MTDEDLDLELVPTDILSMLKTGLDSNPDVAKCGLSLKIDDIPDRYPLKEQVLKDQAKYWNEDTLTDHYVNVIDYGDRVQAFTNSFQFYRADIDTTFAMYRAHEIEKIGERGQGKGLRLKGFPAIHRPWYKGVSELTSEDWYAIQNSETYKIGRASCRERV